MVYPAPHGQAVPPPRSGLARTLGRTTKHVSKRRALAPARPQGLVNRSKRLPPLPAPRVCRAQRGAGAKRPVNAEACTSASAREPRTSRQRQPVPARRALAFRRSVSQGALCAQRVRTCSPPPPTQRSPALSGHPGGHQHSKHGANRVRPNPSLSRDPTRQAAWASWHLRLCCATPPKRLTARVAVSSNVRPRNTPSQTNCPRDFDAHRVCNHY